MKDNKYIYMVPADFKCESVDRFVELNNKMEIKVQEFYGSLKTSKIGSGRKYFELPDVNFDDFKKYVKHINENGCFFNYVLNLSCFDNKEFTKIGQDEIINEIRPIVEAGVTDFTIAMPSFIDLISKNFPNIRITLSIICGVDSLSKMECYCKCPNITNIYIHERVYRQPKLMKEMIDIAHKYNKKVGIIINSFCLSECPFRQYHYNFGAHATFGAEYIIPEYYGSMCALMKINDKRNVLNAPWVRPEDMKFYMNLGVDRFKISGREMFSDDANMYKMVETYSSYKYDGNLAYLFMCFTDCAYSDIFDIKNDENLDKYLKNIQNGNLCCNTFGCNNCLKCSDALKSIVIKQDGLEKWKKIFEDRLEKYRNE